MKYKDLYPSDLKPQRIYCANCDIHMHLVYDKFDEKIEDISFTIDELPYLQCPKCKNKFLPDRSRISLIKIFEEANKNGKKIVKILRRKITNRFNLGEVDFIYDPDDYFYIPGLIREEQDGFLTPVFFNKTVLIKFYNWPGYNISFASRTYGDIGKGIEYGVSFGITQNNKVVMWLGDISELPTEEQHYLRSENIPSDHVIGSEFYDAQIEAEFTERTPEDELIKSWSAMHGAFLKKFAEKSSHLDEETIELIKNIKRPSVFTEKENKDIVETLNKFCIETLNGENFSKLLKDRGLTSKEISKLGGSLKRLQKLLEINFPNNKIGDLLSPFYVLYDLRSQVYSHLTSKKSRDETMKSALARLNMPIISDFTSLYDVLIEQMKLSYNELEKNINE